MLNKADANSDAIIDCLIYINIRIISVATLSIFRLDIVDFKS